MALMEDVMNTAQKVGKYVFDKAEYAKDCVSLEYKAASVRNEINKSFTELGKIIYKASHNQTSNESEKNELIAKIDSLNIELNLINDQMAKFKNICKKCGTKNSAKADYCVKCAAKLK